MSREIKYEELKKVEEKAWTYTLYAYKDKYIISVICGSVGLYDRNIFVDKLIIRQFESEGIIVLDELASTIRNNPKKYTLEHIQLI